MSYYNIFITGVFTSCMLNIFGVVIFLRTGWTVVRSHCYKIFFKYLQKLFNVQLNNGRSTDNDRPKMPLERSLFYLTGHFDHFHAFHRDYGRFELKHETMMYRKKFLIVCFAVSGSVSMTGQKQILTDLKSS